MGLFGKRDPFKYRQNQPAAEIVNAVDRPNAPVPANEVTDEVRGDCGGDEGGDSGDSEPCAICGSYHKDGTCLTIDYTKLPPVVLKQIMTNYDMNDLDFRELLDLRYLGSFVNFTPTATTLYVGEGKNITVTSSLRISVLFGRRKLVANQKVVPFYRSVEISKIEQMPLIFWENVQRLRLKDVRKLAENIKIFLEDNSIINKLKTLESFFLSLSIDDNQMLSKVEDLVHQNFATLRDLVLNGSRLRRKLEFDCVNIEQAKNLRNLEVSNLFLKNLNKLPTQILELSLVDNPIRIMEAVWISENMKQLKTLQLEIDEKADDGNMDKLSEFLSRDRVERSPGFTANHFQEFLKLPEVRDIVIGLTIHFFDPGNAGDAYCKTVHYYPTKQKLMSFVKLAEDIKPLGKWMATISKRRRRDPAGLLSIVTEMVGQSSRSVLQIKVKKMDPNSEVVNPF